jgi:hypothetical protein
MARGTRTRAVSVLLALLLAGSPAFGALPPKKPAATAETPLLVTVTDIGIQINGFFMASEPVDGGTLRTVGHTGRQVAWLDGAEPIPEDAVVLIREFLESPKGVQFIESMKGGGDLRAQSYGDFDVDAVVYEDLTGGGGYLTGGEVDISFDGGDDRLAVGPAPEQPFANCYEGARCFWCVAEGAAWSAAVGAACAGAVTPVMIAACSAAIAAWVEWASRCRGTCNRRNFAC